MIASGAGLNPCRDQSAIRRTSYPADALQLLRVAVIQHQLILRRCTLSHCTASAEGNSTLQEGTAPAYHIYIASPPSQTFSSSIFTLSFIVRINKWHSNQTTHLASAVPALRAGPAACANTRPGSLHARAAGAPLAPHAALCTAPEQEETSSALPSWPPCSASIAAIVVLVSCASISIAMQMFPHQDSRVCVEPMSKRAKVSREVLKYGSFN